jgi:hypothetical protein
MSLSSRVHAALEGRFPLPDWPLQRGGDPESGSAKLPLRTAPCGMALLISRYHAALSMYGPKVNSPLCFRVRAHLSGFGGSSDPLATDLITGNEGQVLP